MSLAGQSFIITGASQGAGLIFARALLERGALVVMSDEVEEALEAAAAPLLLQYPATARHFVADPADTLDMTNLMSFTIDAFDRLDVLINDARAIVEGDILDPEDDTLREMFIENVMAAQNITHAFLRRLRRLAQSRAQVLRGGIVHLVSTPEGRRRVGLGGFAVSSAAVEELVDVLAPRLAKEGVHLARIGITSLPSEPAYLGQEEELVSQLLEILA